jgi:4-alpha-glucanotransferase
LAIIALESHRARAFVVGEDLGTLDSLARDKFNATGILSYRLLWFEDEPPTNYPKQALAAINTHDLPTVAGLWTGEDDRELAKAGVKTDAAGWRAIRNRLTKLTGVPEDAPAEEVIYEAYRCLGQAPSSVVTASIEDALAVPHRPNMPGAATTWPNWSRPLPGGLEALEHSALARKVAGELNHARNRRALGPAPIADRR